MQLVRDAQAGDREAMGRLLTTYQHRIHAVCYRMLGNREDALDLTQDALANIIRGLASYDRRSAFSTWAIRVAMNACLSHLRKQRLRRHASLDDELTGRPLSDSLTGSTEPSALERVEHAERHEMLQEALLQLDPEMRAMLVLRDGRGLEYREIAQVFDIAVGTVKSRLFRARLALREAIEAADRSIADEGLSGEQQESGG
jgi:RNA polymerase sigma-70 factor (ECF subfamily)